MQDDAWDAIVAAPGFSLGIVVADSVVSRIEFLAPMPGRAARTATGREAERQLNGYLRDPAIRFDLPLAAAASAHQQKVRAAMLAIAPGDTLTYGEIARRIGSSARAVGGACGANPFPVVVPCHRVIGAGGALGGFAHSTTGFLPGIKRWLLAHECAGCSFRLTESDPALS